MEKEIKWKTRNTTLSLEVCVSKKTNLCHKFPSSHFDFIDLLRLAMCLFDLVLTYLLVCPVCQCVIRVVFFIFFCLCFFNSLYFVVKQEKVPLIVSTLYYWPSLIVCEIITFCYIIYFIINGHCLFSLLLNDVLSMASFPY